MSRPAETSLGLPGGFTPEELALLQQALDTGRVDTLPLAVQEALEDDPMLAAQVLENTHRLDALPTHLFDATGLLNEEGIALAVDALRRNTAAELHPAILAHLEASQESAARVADAALEIRNAELNRDNQPNEGRPGRTRPIGATWFRWGVAVAAIAASLALIVLVGPQWFGNAGSSADVATQASPTNEAPEATLADGNPMYESAAAEETEERDDSAIRLEAEGLAQSAPEVSSRLDASAAARNQPMVENTSPSLFSEVLPGYMTQQEDVRETIQQNAQMATSQTTSSAATAEQYRSSEMPPLASADDAGGVTVDDADFAAESETHPIESQTLTDSYTPSQQSGRRGNSVERAQRQNVGPAAPTAAGAGSSGDVSRARTSYGSISNPPAHDLITRLYLATPMNRRYRPLQTALLDAWKATKLTGYDYHNPTSRLTFIQLQNLIGTRINSPDAVIELVEKGQQRGHPNVVYLKLRWGGPNGHSVIFPMQDRQLQALLVQTKLENPNNEAAVLSAQQLLELRAFEGRPAYGSHDELLPD